MTFQDLKLSAPLLRAVEEKGYTTPTPIQARAIPPALAGRDLLGCAQTGTGKTAAFTLPILQLLDEAPRTKGRRPIRALVLTPTRELAIQIDECCRDYARHTPLRHTVIFGGVNQRPQVDALQRGVDLLIATPGRLLDLIGQGYISLDAVRHFVLDEADRMLDMGFIHDIRRILPLLPERKQTLFFSATMPESIASLAASLLHDPAEVTVTPPASVVETIGQQVGFVAKSDKSKRLVALLEASDAKSVLVFSRTKHGADRIARILNKAGIAANAIHGDKSQGAREKAMNGFKAGTCRVLVATDIAARGIDISELPLVVNYDLPEVSETYVHRIGRTGRAGCEGRAYSFCAEEEIPLLRDIEKTIGRRIPVDDTAERPEWAPAALPEPAQERRSPKRQPAPKQQKPAGASKQQKPAGAPKQQNPAESPKQPKPAPARQEAAAEAAAETKSARPSRRRRRKPAAAPAAQQPRREERPAAAQSRKSEPGTDVRSRSDARSGKGPGHSEARAATPPSGAPSHRRKPRGRRGGKSAQQPAAEPQPAQKRSVWSWWPWGRK